MSFDVDLELRLPATVPKLLALWGALAWMVSNLRSVGGTFMGWDSTCGLRETVQLGGRIPEGNS